MYVMKGFKEHLRALPAVLGKNLPSKPYIPTTADIPRTNAERSYRKKNHREMIGVRFCLPSHATLKVA